MDLDVRNQNQVAGHSVVRADLGVGGRQLVVLSGTAIPAWKIDDESTHRDSCRVLLHEPAESLEQSTVHVGLASIQNEDTEYVFAADQATLQVDSTGELVLVTNLALMGEASFLHRFSYQVVLTNRIVTTEITGTLSWPTRFLRPSSATPAGVSGVFTITANLRTTTPGGGPFGGTIEHLVPVAPGHIVSVTIADDTCHAIYRIPEPPKNQQLKVTVVQQGMHGPGQVTMEPVGFESNILTLSVAQPSRSNVDFVAATLAVS
ncbi:hypothetical protein [Cryptosporangium sp. NPDC051539]|uniref:hypothetical protein n=1 Tax=Cryptosporangium sp. NPDC051539 TaxID=3363962 RepID=UPI0037A2DB12